MEQEQIKRIIEALLFSQERPLSLTQIKEVLEEVDLQEIKEQIRILGDEYQNTGRSFQMREIAGGYQLSTKAEYALWLKKLYHTSRSEKLTHPSLETLAIVAYRQPITRLEIEDIRGVNVEGVLKTLLDRSLLRISGRKDVPGRPFLYSTTKVFLETFGLQGLADLPQLEEFERAALQLQKKSENMGGKQDGEAKHIPQENKQD